MWIGQEGCYCLLVADGVITDFTAFAGALIGLNMRTGGNLLQIQRDRLGAFCAFEGQGAGWLAHGISIIWISD